MAEVSDTGSTPDKDHALQASTADLNTQLVQAREELAELERAVETLPDIFETKFRAAVKSVMDTNRALALEQQQLSEAVRTALPPASPLRLPAVTWKFSPHDWQRYRKPGLLLGVGMALCLVLGGVMAQRSRMPRPSSATAQRQPAPLQTDSVLQLRADGSSWVEVQDLHSREVLLIGVLEAGETRTIRLRQGLRIRSGRPDLLTLQIDDAPPRAFGDINGLGWRTVLPPNVRKAGA
jgi:hypothetical protein